MIRANPELLPNPPPYANQQAPAHEIEQALKGKQDASEDRQSDQRRYTTAGQNTVIDFHHVDGAREVEDVHQRTRKSDCDYGFSALTKRVGELIGGGAICLGGTTS